jgi:5-methylcytosine-specific restriction endonuclease McrA
MTDAAVRALVRNRAGDRCEYCRLPQAAIDGRFHVEHIVARQHRRDDRPGNLCLACARCNLRKGPNLSAIDDVSGEVVPLFNPRTDKWDDHFQLEGPLIVGRTPQGRATVRLLQMNDRRRVELRAELLAAGEF